MNKAKFLLFLSYLGATLLAIFVYLSSMNKTFLEVFLIFFIISSSSTIAYYMWMKHNEMFQPQTLNWLALIYIPFMYLYMIIFELSVNYYRFLVTDASPLYHLQKHIFSHWWQFLIIFIASWYAFQKFSFKKAMIIVWVLGSLFECLFVTKSIFGIFTGLIWVWMLTTNWLIVRYLDERIQNILHLGK